MSRFKIFNIQESTDKCDGCQYFDMEKLNYFKAYTHPIYYMFEKSFTETIEEVPINEIPFPSVDDFEQERVDFINGKKSKLIYLDEIEDAITDVNKLSALKSMGVFRIPLVIKKRFNDDDKINFKENHKNLNRYELDKIFKSRGYLGISDLCWDTYLKWI